MWRAWVPLFLVVVIAGCPEPATQTGADLLQRADLTASPDLASAVDLTLSATDLAALPSEDLAALPSEDLTTLPPDDLAALPPEDLTALPDLTIVPDPLVVICHVPTATPLEPVLLEVPTSQAAAHFGHGDPRGLAHPTVHVDVVASAAGLGTELQPLVRATDALALQRCRYRATGEAGTIQFAPGRHLVSYDATTLAANPTYEPGPLVVDFPVTLRGATAVSLDDDGRPVPGYTAYDATSATYLVAAAPLLAQDSQSLVLIADTHDVRVEGFVLRSGHCRDAALCPDESTVATWGGNGILTVRSDGVELASNVLEPGFFSALQGWGSTLTLRQNYAADTEICVSCLNGPGRFEVLSNRFDNGLGGVLVSPTLTNVPFSLGTQAAAFSIAQFTAATDLALDVTVDNNVLGQHTRNANSFGVRIVAYGRETAALVTRQILTAHLRNNRIENDNGSAGATQGLLIDAGFSDRLASGLLAATLFVDIAGNTLHTTDRPVAVMTMRAQTLLGGAASQWKTYGPLESATVVVDSDVLYPDEFRVDHLASDPLADQTTAGGVCVTDADCSTATYRAKALPGLCNASKVCQCLPGLVDTVGTCTDPRPTSNVVVINGAVITPGTAIP